MFQIILSYDIQYYITKEIKSIMRIHKISQRFLPALYTAEFLPEKTARSANADLHRGFDMVE